VGFDKIPELFSIYEDELRKNIDHNDSPFLGLFADFFRTTTREELTKIIHGFSRPVDDYIWNFHNYPALLATLMTVGILEEFGASGHFEVYSHIERLLNVKLTWPEKQRLWKAYRSACLRLGLSVSPRTSGIHYIVHEFLRQAGLPMQFVGRFCERVMKYADRVGIPDEDNPEEVKLWQQEFVRTVKTSLPKIAKKAIERDENSYYVGMFISLYQNRNQNPEDLSRLEQSMLETLVSSSPSKQSGKKARIPQVILKNFIEYGVLLPPGDKGYWLLDTDENQSKHTTHGEELFVPFDEQSLPPSVTLTDNEGISWQYPLWEKGEENRLLIFMLPSGKLVQSASLPDKEVSLEPGEYALLLRFLPRGEQDTELFSDCPKLFIKKRILLSPGESLSLCYGPAKLTLKADEMPLLLWQSKPVSGVRGNEFYPVEDLKLQVIIPEEMKRMGTEFFLQLSSSKLGEDIHVPANFGDGTRLDLDLAPWITSWSPGVARLQVALRRGGSGRLVVRRSIVIWNGLKAIKDRCLFQCDGQPVNEVPNRCENLRWDPENQTYTYRDETNRFFKMAFENTHRIYEFVWAVPGIFLGVVDYSDGRQTEKSISLGSTVSVKTASRKMLKIYANHPAVLQLGSFSQFVNFTRVGAITLPLGNLQEYMGTGKNHLCMCCDDWAEPLPLVHLVSPFTATEFTCHDDAAGKRVEVALAESIEGIRIITENLLDGERAEIEFSHITMAKDNLMQGVVVTCFSSSPEQLTLYISANSWPPGLWLVHFHVKASGRWGMLTNEAHQFYAEGQLAHEKKVISLIHTMFDPLCRKENATDEFGFEREPGEAMLMFHRLQHALYLRYAAGIWYRLVWIEKYWAMICKDYLIRIKDGAHLSTLLRLSTQWRDHSFQEGELPSLHIGAMLPGMYGLHRNQYRIKGEIRNSLLSVFKFIPRMGDLVRAFSSSDLEVAALFGFSNAEEVSTQNAKPQSFSFETYKMVLIARNFPEKNHLLYDNQWLPGNGDYLGPIHYRYAVMKLKEAFENNLVIDSLIRGKALGMVREFSSKHLDCYCSANGLTDFSRTIDLGLWEEGDGIPLDISDEATTQREHCERMIRFLSLFAQVCRMENRQPGTIDAFLDSFEKIPRLSEKECRESLAFLLYVGEDLFAFYLLLWEMIFTADYSYCTVVKER